MNNVIPFDTAMRGHSGRSFAYPTGNLPYADAWRLARAERLLDFVSERVQCPHCLDELIQEILERGDGLTGLERLARRVAGETRQ